MRIGISTWSFSNLNPKTGFDIIDLAKENGFDCLDFTLDHYNTDQFPWVTVDYNDMVKHFEELKIYADKVGISFSQVHSPYALFPDFLTESFYQTTLRALKIAQLVGAPYAVMHPLVFPEYRGRNMITSEKNYNLEYLNRFIPYLKEYDVKIALENIYDWTNDKKIRFVNVSHPQGLRDYMDELPKEHFGLCLDTGHLNMAGHTMDEIITVWKDDLKVLHINDNLGVIDDHLMPYMGSFDWTDFKKKLKSINYNGVLSNEIKPFEYLGKIDNGFKFAAALSNALNKD